MAAARRRACPRAPIDARRPRGALLAGRGDPHLDRALADSMVEDAPPQVRSRAAWLAALTLGPATDDALAGLIDDDDEDVRLRRRGVR